MNLQREKKGINSIRPYLIALHSSTNTLGIAILDSRSPQATLNSSIFPINRNLSNKIISCVEELLPSSKWPQLCRIAVSIGPGGFTSTRITVVMARTLAQQLDCNLDGISSFALMAPRLANSLASSQKKKPFWIVKTLPRRGIIAGKYLIRKSSNTNDFEIGQELEGPRLISSTFNLNPSINTSDDVRSDVLQLIRISLISEQENDQKCWKDVIPIYPTSPVD